MAKKCTKCPPPAPSWLMTFADLSTLLLTFFVLLISMATFNPVRFAQVLGYFQTPTGLGYNIPTPQDPVTAEEFFVQIVRASAIRQDTPEGGYRPTLAGEHMRVTSHRDHYVVRFTDRPFFERFEVRLTPEGKRRLSELARHLKDSINVIHVVGRCAGDEHDDAFGRVLEDLPTRDGQVLRVLATPEELFASGEGGVQVAKVRTALLQSRNELAAKRAETVSNFLQAAGVDRERIREVVREDSPPAEELESADDGGAFIFAWGGSETNRTVEVIVTQEVVTRR
jgi:flagellar motor protein MotB